jgi:hypothetical protein
MLSTMNTLILKTAAAAPPRRDPRIAGPRATEDTVSSPYLRHWLDHQAAQHRDLLLNIAAAPRIGVGPAVSKR